MTPPWMKLVFYCCYPLFFFITCARSKRYQSSRLSSLPVFSLFLSLALCVVRGLNQLPCCAALLPPPPPLSQSLSSAFLLRHSRWVVVVVVIAVVGGGSCFINFLTLLFFHRVVRKLFLLSPPSLSINCQTSFAEQLFDHNIFAVDSEK